MTCGPRCRVRRVSTPSSTSRSTARRTRDHQGSPASPGEAQRQPRRLHPDQPLRRDHGQHPDSPRGRGHSRRRRGRPRRPGDGHARGRHDPRNIPDEIVIDVSRMDMDTVIHLADIELPDGVTATADDDVALVTVLFIRAEELESDAEPDEVEEGEEGEEGEGAEGEEGADGESADAAEGDGGKDASDSE
ncbi:MAG: hypothetical protein WKF58_01665 [Ilumatobacteraceae bacterium]